MKTMFDQVEKTRSLTRGEELHRLMMERAKELTLEDRELLHTAGVELDWANAQLTALNATMNVIEDFMRDLQDALPGALGQKFGEVRVEIARIRGRPVT